MNINNYREVMIRKILNEGINLSRVGIVTNSNPIDLLNKEYIEKIILQLGMNIEKPLEQPDIVNNNGGGLYIWQYPNQFASYLLFIQQFKINSYLEIGCRWGGTFILTTEYLKKINTLNNSVAVDIIESPIQEYCKNNDYSDFWLCDSKSNEFKKKIENKFFDIIFIDGDHSYLGVSTDYETCKNNSNIFVFHDIVNNSCPGVVQFWNEIKMLYSDKYFFYEFTQQYEDVFKNTGKTFLGIGVAISKTL